MSADETLAASMHVPKNPPRGGDHPLYVFDRTIGDRIAGSISDRLYGGLTLEEIQFRASDPVGFNHKHGRGGPLSWEDQREAQSQEYLPPSLRRMSLPHTPARRRQIKEAGERGLERLPIANIVDNVFGPAPVVYPRQSEKEGLTPEQVQYAEEWQDIMRHQKSMPRSRSNAPLRDALFGAIGSTGHSGEGTWRVDPANPYRRVEGEKRPEMDNSPRPEMDTSPKMKDLLELYEKSQDKRMIPPEDLLVS